MFGLASCCCESENSSKDVPATLDWADRVFNELAPSSIFWELAPCMVKEQAEVTPAFDISETDEHFVVRADLPGVDVKDLDISLTGDVLTIKGQKREQRVEEGENCCFSERQFGSFSRSFTLPSNAKEDGIEAAYKDGVLQLHIPKVETIRQKKIEVKAH